MEAITADCDECNSHFLLLVTYCIYYDMIRWSFHLIAHIIVISICLVPPARSVIPKLLCT